MTVVRALSLCFVCLLAACAARLERPSALTRARLEENAALAADDHPARARFAADLGLGPDAVFHAATWLEQARAERDIARANGSSGAALRDATRQVERAARMALEVGRRYGHGDLVVDATLAARRPNMGDLAWGCAHADYWSGDPTELLETARRDPEAWMAAWNLLTRSDWTLDELDERVGMPTGAMLRALDARGNVVRWSMLDAELRGGALTQRAVELAATIAEHDPSDVRARVLLELRDAMKDGTLVADADLLSDHVEAWAPLSVLSRARRRFEAFVDAPAAKLHYAHLLLARGLSGDALAVLRSETAPWTTDDQRDLAALIEALAGVRAGAPGAYEAWRERHDDAPSLAADQQLSSWWGQTTAMDEATEPPGPLRDALLAAALRRVDARDRSLSGEDMVRAWSSGALSRRSTAWVRGHLGPLAPMVDACLEDGGTPNVCAPIATAPHLQANAVVAERGLGHAAGAALVHQVSAASLDAHGWQRLEEMADTTLALSSGFTSIYVEGLVARGRLEDADAWLQRFGNTLAPAHLAGLQLTLADQFSGRGDPDDPIWMRLSPKWPADTSSAPAAGERAPLDPRAPWADQILAASNHVSAGAFGPAEEIYLRLAATVPAPAKSQLMALAARAAFESGDQSPARAPTSPASPRTIRGDASSRD